MKVFLAIVLPLLLISCHSGKRLVTAHHQEYCHPVEPTRNYNVTVTSVQHTYREFLFDLSKEGQGGEGYKRIEIQPDLGEGNLVSIFERDVFITSFYSKNYCIISPQIKVYHPNMQLSSIEELADTFSSNNKNITGYFYFFKALRHGKSLYYWPNGNLAGITYYRHGQNDTFDKAWYSSKNLYYHRHKDTQSYYNEDGTLLTKEYYKTIGKNKFYSQYLYWPNGKLRTEKYYTNNTEWIRCHIWVEYNEKGKVIKKTEYKADNQPMAISPDHDEPIYATVETLPCDFEKNISDGLKAILLKQTITKGGKHELRFSVKNGIVSFEGITGNGGNQLAGYIEKELQNWYCTDPENKNRSGNMYVTNDFYKVNFWIEE